MTSIAYARSNVIAYFRRGLDYSPFGLGPEKAPLVVGNTLYEKRVIRENALMFRGIEPNHSL